MKTTIPFALSSLALLLISAPAQAEHIRLSMEDAVARASGATTEVSESRRDLSVAKANLARSQTWLPDDPQLSVGAYHSTLKEDVFNQQEQFVGRRGYGPNYTVSISQEFEVAGQRGLRMDAATKDVDRARLTLKFQRESLAATAKTAFVHALIENEKLTVAQRAHDATADLTQSRRDEGRVDANLLRIQDAHTRSELAQAKQSRNQAFTALRRLCRLSAAQEVELVGSTETQVHDLAPFEELVRRALANRADLAALHAGVDSANSNLAAKHREKIPNVTLAASVQEFAGATLAGGEITVPIPIFHGKVGDVEEALAERNHLARQQDLTKAEIEKEVSETYEACNVAAVTLQAYQHEIVPLNEENVQIQRKLYAREDIEVGDLISSQVDYFTAQTEYLAAVEDYNTHLFELQRVVAGDIAPNPGGSENPQ